MHITIMTCLLVLSLFTSAKADEVTIESGPPPAASSPSVDIIPGADGGSIRFVINGTPVAVIDADGLHVRDDLDYGGSLTDTGPSGFDRDYREREAAHE